MQRVVRWKWLGPEIWPSAKKLYFPRLGKAQEVRILKTNATFFDRTTINQQKTCHRSRYSGPMHDPSAFLYRPNLKDYVYKGRANNWFHLQLCPISVFSQELICSQTKFLSEELQTLNALMFSCGRSNRTYHRTQRGRKSTHTLSVKLTRVSVWYM